MSKHTHVAQAFPQVAIDGVLEAVASEVANNADLKGLSRQEVS